jgi:hypothetical protein
LFEESHGTLDEERRKKTPLLPMTIINRLERSCGTFKRGEGKTLLFSMTLGQFV